MADASNIPLPLRERRCGLYLPGHMVHHIQALKAAGDPGVPVEVIGVDGDALLVAVEGGVRLYRNHQPRRVLVLANEYGDPVLVERYNLLRVGRGSGRPVFSLAAHDAAMRECPPPLGL